MNDQICTLCPNRCPKEHLACRQGVAFFYDNAAEGTPPADTGRQEMLHSLLRACGHYLHNHPDAHARALFDTLTTQEQRILMDLAKKLLEHWDSDDNPNKQKARHERADDCL